MKIVPIAISAVAFFLLTTGCQPTKCVASSSKPKKRETCQSLTLEAVSEKNVHCGWQGKSAPYLHTGGFAAEADFIYWRVDEEGLDYVLTSNGSSSTFHRPEISWDPGFKFGAGYTWGDQDFWDLFLRWTHLNTHQQGEKKASSALIPVWSPTVLGQALKSSVDWKVRYNTLDLELGRNYFVSKTLALRPYIGMRAAAILQHYEAKYFLSAHMKAQNNFRGIGARAGTLLRWHFTQDWSVIGAVAGSLLYGSFDLHQKVDDFGFKDEFSKVATNLEASLGFEWEYFFCDDDYRVAISVAYEFSEWFSQNRMKQFNLIEGVTTVGSQNGDLGLQGGTFQVRFDF